MFRKTLTALIGASALASMTAFAGDNHTYTAAEMLDRTVEPWAEMPGASILTRTKKKIKLNGYTTGLEPNSAYTIWWVIYNKPENCVDGTGAFDEVGCAKDEVEDPMLAEEVQSSMLWAGGFITDANGYANFNAELKKGDPLGDIAMGPGLLEPKEAEVHFLIRSHGEMKVGMVAEQISTLMANCLPQGEYACSNVQGGVHKVETEH